MTPTQINILTITSKLLQEKKYLDSFPEYYHLAAVTENNLWHDHQNVLDHVIGVFAGLERILKFEDMADSRATKINQYLAAMIGNKTRKENLQVAALLHDIAKVDAIIKNSDGMTSCPGHELMAAARVKNFSKRFCLDQKDELFVERIVRYHGFVPQILDLIIANDNQEKYFAIFMETVGDVVAELIFMMQADLLGCDLEKTDKKGFDVRMAILAWMNEQLFSAKLFY